MFRNSSSPINTYLLLFLVKKLFVCTTKQVVAFDTILTIRVGSHFQLLQTSLHAQITRQLANFVFSMVWILKLKLEIWCSSSNSSLLIKIWLKYTKTSSTITFSHGDRLTFKIAHTNPSTIDEHLFKSADRKAAQLTMHILIENYNS